MNVECVVLDCISYSLEEEDAAAGGVTGGTP